MNLQALSIHTLCAIAGISRRSIFREIAEGRLTACKAGARTVIRAEDLLSWMESNPAYKKQAMLTESGEGQGISSLAKLFKVEPSRHNLRLAYSIGEFASLTSLSPGLIRKEIMSGHLVETKVSQGRVIISAAAAEAWFRNLETRKAG
jgi:hypothetical protein